MATNHYFNNFENSLEQRLIDDLVIESIQIYGHDVYYIPRTVVNRDTIMNEPEYATFNDHLMVEMYIENVDGFGGDGEFLSKIGMEIRDQITLAVAIRSFDKEVEEYEFDIVRPREGDLIYMPMTNALYQIHYVDPKAIFYQMGALQTYSLTCELFEYSQEVFDTGIPEIDDKYNDYSIDLSGYELLDTDGNVLQTTEGHDLVLTNYDLETLEPQSQNEDFQEESDNLLEFDESNPWGDV